MAVSYRVRILFYLLALGLLSVVAYRQFRRDPYATEFSEVLQLVQSSYVEEVGRPELFEDAMRGMTARLDPHSTYIAPESVEAMEVVLDREYAGVGMTLEKRTLDGPLIVLSPFFSTPAYHAGIRSGDAIFEIDGVSTLGMPRSDAVMRIRGEPGDPVTLKLRHPGAPAAVETVIKRQRIELPSLIGDTRHSDGSWDFRLGEDRRIAYVRLVSFGKRSLNELKVVLGTETATPLEAIILDLRNNAGGHLQSAVEICDLFLDRGVIVTTRDRAGLVRDQFQATAALGVPLDLPLAILVNNYSASSSEIVAACLQDHQRAIVIGSRTWGKGSVQTVFRLNSSGGALKLTTATYWRPSGANIQRGRNSNEDEAWGVSPNSGFEVSLSDEEARQLWSQRRWRDVPPNDTDPSQPPSTTSSGPSPPGQDATDAAERLPEIDDRVLRRAIETLQAVSRREP